MRHCLPLLLILLGFAVQVSGADASVVQGEWKAEPAACWTVLKATEPIRSLPPEQQAKMETSVMEQMATMSFTFTNDKIVTRSGTDTQEQAYKISAADGDQLVIETTTDKGVTEKTSLQVTGDTMRLTSTSQPDVTLVLKRQPKP
jgi:ABC-type hemin transport system ATPase subunit